VDVLTCHIEADFDALASLVAARRLYPRAVVVFPGAQEKVLRDFTAEGRLPELPVVALRDLDPAAVRRLILVDTRRADRIGPLGEIAARRDVEVHIYDHHPPGPGDLAGAVDVSHPVGANTTLMLRILRERDIAIAPAEATLFLLGIHQETGSLTYAGTTPEDCEAAAFCLRRGGDLDVVARFLPRDLDAAQVAILDDLLRSASPVEVHGVRICVGQATRDEYVGGLGDLASRAATILKAPFFAVVRMEDRVFVVGRSREAAVDCAAVLARLGGGGHRAAAAASVKGRTLVEVRDQLLEALPAVVTAGSRARDCMTREVVALDSGETIAGAAERVARDRFDVLPVLRSDSLVGLLDRQTIERALHHGLGGAAVEDYMTTDFATVAPDAPIEAIERVMGEGPQRLVPVLDRGALVGVITRENLVAVAREPAAGQPLLPVHGEGEASDESPEGRRRGVRTLLRERLPAPLVDLLAAAGETAAERGMRAYVVGGFVRDLFLGEENYDIDVVVEGDGIRFAEAFARRTGGRLRRHEMFGTAVVVLPRRPDLPGGEAGFHVDVATARLETYARPGALPTVERGSLRADLLRRDFTINTLAIGLDPSGFGELIDFFGGQRDLKDRHIRVLHTLSFVEDPTRAFRALRFEARFHMRIGKFTERLLRQAAAHLDAVSGPRILNEILPILAEPRAAAILRRLDETGILPALHPALRVDEASERRLERVREAVSWFRLLYTSDAFVPWLPAWLALTARLADGDSAQLESRLGIGGRVAVKLAAARAGAREAPRALKAIAEGRAVPPSAVARALDPIPVEGLLWLMAGAADDASRRAISRFILEWRHVRPALSGRDVIALGVPEGPAVGEALRDLRDARLDGKVRGRAEEQARVTARGARRARGAAR
jgi:tRNA nucleotidyltransferase (CCA-adding enzyme)